MRVVCIWLASFTRFAAAKLITTTIHNPQHNHQQKVGLTDETQYEHRVGRTGRAGKTGLALLLLADDEARMLSTLKDFPITPARAGSPVTGGLAAGAPVPPPPAALARAIGEVARGGELRASADKAFVATLGFLAGMRCLFLLCVLLCPSAEPTQPNHILFQSFNNKT